MDRMNSVIAALSLRAGSSHAVTKLGGNRSGARSCTHATSGGAVVVIIAVVGHDADLSPTFASSSRPLAEPCGGAPDAGSATSPMCRGKAPCCNTPSCPGALPGADAPACLDGPCRADTSVGPDTLGCLNGLSRLGDVSGVVVSGWLFRPDCGGSLLGRGGGARIPAIQRVGSPGRVKRWTCFAPSMVAHSKYAVAGITVRCRTADCRNEGLSTRVSARALIMAR